MRGRCCQGCDRQAKNTLDLNYLARAKASSGGGSASVRVRAEVTTITRDSDSGMYRVTYNDLIRGKRADGAFRTVTVCAQHVFLCAGSLGSTELLYANSALLDLTTSGGSTPLGSHYFPNADSLAVVFKCDEPHDADDGPTITSALLYQSPVDRAPSEKEQTNEAFSLSLDFWQGRLNHGCTTRPRAGVRIEGQTSRATAFLEYEPVLDWGSWSQGESSGAAGALVLSDVTGQLVSTKRSTSVASRRLPRPRRSSAGTGSCAGRRYSDRVRRTPRRVPKPACIRRNRFVETIAPRPRAVGTAVERAASSVRRWLGPCSPHRARA